jgi:hypothetical protein
MTASRTVNCSHEKPESSIKRPRGVPENERENSVHEEGRERLSAFAGRGRQDALRIHFGTVLDSLKDIAPGSDSYINCGQGCNAV